jgi:hypothetical protein
MPKVKQADNQSSNSEVNEDGLIPGVEVDFQTLQRILAEQRNGTQEAKEDDAN